MGDKRLSDILKKIRVFIQQSKLAKIKRVARGSDSQTAEYYLWLTLRMHFFVWKDDLNVSDLLLQRRFSRNRLGILVVATSDQNVPYFWTGCRGSSGGSGYTSFIIRSRFKAKPALFSILP